MFIVGILGAFGRRPVNEVGEAGRGGTAGIELRFSADLDQFLRDMLRRSPRPLLD